MIYKAELETRNFSFEAYGETDQAAIYAMNEGLEKHAIQLRIVVGDFIRSVEDDIIVRQIDLGRAYRDREPI